MSKRNNQKKDDSRKESWEDKESRDMKRDRKRDKFKSASKRAGANDVSWYIPDPQLLRDVASLPWSEQAGQRPATSGVVYGPKFSAAYPGVAAMKIVPTLGDATKPNDAVNAAAQAIYTFVRHANSGSKNYDPTDLMMYIMSLDSIYYFVSWITRLYATVNMYAMQNKYLPDLLFKAQGVDGASIRADIPGFRARVNSLIMKISTLVIPNTMPIFKRHSFLFSNYYTEGDTIKDQIYMYVPDGYYLFTYDSDGKGMLNYSHFANNLNASTIIATLEAMVDQIYMEEDFGIMAGDILKAYGEGGVEKIGLIPDLLTAQPVYNYEVLMQFKNAKCFHYKNTSMWNVTQVIDPNYPVSPYIVTGPNNSSNAIEIYQYNTNGTSWNSEFGPITINNTDLRWSMLKRTIDEISKQTLMVSANPTVSPEESMVSSRLSAACDYTYLDGGTNFTASTIRYAFGSEWPIEVTYWGNVYEDGVLTQQSFELAKENQINKNSVWVSGDQTYNIGNPIALAAVVSNFHYHPEHNLYYNGNATTDSENCWISDLPVLDVDNYTFVSFDTLDKLHSIAILGEFNVPRLSIG